MNALKDKLRAMPRPSSVAFRHAKDNAEWEIRLDAGESRKDNSDLVAVKLQINREAKTKGLKDLVKANGTHHTYATAWVNVKEHPTKEAAAKLVDDLIKDLEDD
ncbi:hypothetical protein ACJ73_07247 [Blastomyces percursus]|uniref:Uncharacterized protein n=1 Tax=Blastomyces percursus TaxID=1658174 RepID=A0A1J9QMJ0_9EURO|nr:hypothetical protein ACJ73_07247 [Blastomyces percursus]